MVPLDLKKPDVFLQGQLDIIDVLLSMYVGAEEMTMSSSSTRLLNSLRAHLDPEGAYSCWAPDETNITLKLAVLVVETEQDTHWINLNISVPLEKLETLDHSDSCSYTLRLAIERPPWLKRKTFDVLAAGLNSTGEDIVFEAVEYLQSTGKDLYDKENVDSPITEEGSEDAVLTRVWFYLPSLSTREKRDDLVTMAPSYGLTGFVLAGKPGVLCVEGSAPKVQAYLADIKRNSWGDIPSFQKKISERFREDNVQDRKFSNMVEITDDIDRHGHKKNRGNLSQVEDFLLKAGLPDAFGRVFMQRD